MSAAKAPISVDWKLNPQATFHNVAGIVSLDDLTAYSKGLMETVMRYADAGGTAADTYDEMAINTISWTDRVTRKAIIWARNDLLFIRAVRAIPGIQRVYVKMSGLRISTIWGVSDVYSDLALDLFAREVMKYEYANRRSLEFLYVEHSELKREPDHNFVF